MDPRKTGGGEFHALALHLYNEVLPVVWTQCKNEVGQWDCHQPDSSPNNENHDLRKI